METAKQFVDLAITRLKFDRELADFRVNETEFRKKGIVCVQVIPPSIDLMFCVPHMAPIAIAFAVRIDYTNWDVEPPSIAFIDPFSERYLSRHEIAANFWQVQDRDKVAIQGNQVSGMIDLLQPAGGDNIWPFVCIPGVYEYHKHYAHSGDSWMLYRTRGEGKLCVLVDQLYRHSIQYIAGYQIQAQFAAVISGLSPDLGKLRQ